MVGFPFPLRSVTSSVDYSAPLHVDTDMEYSLNMDRFPLINDPSHMYEPALMIQPDPKVIISSGPFDSDSNLPTDLRDSQLPEDLCDMDLSDLVENQDLALHGLHIQQLIDNFDEKDFRMEGLLDDFQNEAFLDQDSGVNISNNESSYQMPSLMTPLLSLQTMTKYVTTPLLPEEPMADFVTTPVLPLEPMADFVTLPVLLQEPMFQCLTTPFLSQEPMAGFVTRPILCQEPISRCVTNLANGVLDSNKSTDNRISTEEFWSPSTQSSLDGFSYPATLSDILPDYETNCLTVLSSSAISGNSHEQSLKLFTPDSGVSAPTGSLWGTIVKGSPCVQRYSRES